MPWPKTVATHYRAQKGIPDQGRTNQRVECLLFFMVRLYGLGGMVFGPAQGAWSAPLLWSGWLSSSSTATQHRYIQIHIT